MTTNANRWLLPDGVDEVLPPRAGRLEALRREILELYRTWGYELIKTPLIEFLDSLLIVPSHELQLSTFQIVDQLSGRSMGVRADISSQAARIDAHVLQKNGPVRLCYADSVLRTRPNGQLGSRSPQLIGAELYGHKGEESDIEVICLMLETLDIAGIDKPLLALGHSNICRSLLRSAGLPAEQEAGLFAALQNKSSTDIEQQLAVAGIDPALGRALRALPGLHGDPGVLDEAVALSKSLGTSLGASVGKEFGKELELALKQPLDQLRGIVAALRKRRPEQKLYLDLCELGGYEYHNGMIFSAYVSGHGEAIAKGGRYDDIGAVFGRARPATGFDADLKTLLTLSKREFPEVDKVYAPAETDAGLDAAVAALRENGKVVVQGFSSDADRGDAARELGCSHVLLKQDDRWVVLDLK